MRIRGAIIIMAAALLVDAVKPAAKGDRKGVNKLSKETGTRATTKAMTEVKHDHDTEVRNGPILTGVTTV